MKKSLVLIISLILLLGLAACDVSLAGDVTPPPGARMPLDQPTQLVEAVSMPEGLDLQAGAAWYVEKCADCHGPQGLGDGIQAGALGVLIPPIGVMEQAYLASPLEWFDVVHNGRMGLLMPPFKGSMSNQDIWDVLGFVYGLGSDQALLADGEALYAETCATCHGPEGEGGAAAGAPSLLDPERMTALSLAEIAQKIATGSGNDDHAFANQLDSDQQQAAALYVRSLLFGTLDSDVVVEEPAAEESTATAEINEAEEAATDEPSEETTAEEQTESAAPAAGTAVTGLVVNKSGTAIPEGLQVSLQGYVNYEKTIDLSAPIATDGSFVFEDVVLEADSVYFAVVEHQGMFYPSDFYMAEGGDQDVVFEVEIYDTTTDTSQLVVSRLHVFFEWITPERVQVVHLVTVSNLGTETVFNPIETEAVLNFSIPAEATNLVFETGVIGEPYITTESGFGDPRPVPPGEGAYEVLFAYEMAYDKELTWNLPVDILIELAAVFVQGEDLNMESAQLSAGADQVVQGGVYQTMSAQSLAAGDMISMEISGRVKIADPEDVAAETSDIIVLIVGGLGLLLTAFGVWRYFGPVGHEIDDLDTLTSDELIDEIAALDDAFEAGEIDPSDYRQEREELKARLRELLNNN